jgi:hypothetical protein
MHSERSHKRGARASECSKRVRGCGRSPCLSLATKKPDTHQIVGGSPALCFLSLTGQGGCGILPQGLTRPDRAAQKAALPLWTTVKRNWFSVVSCMCLRGLQYPTDANEDRMKRLDYLNQAFCVFFDVPPFAQYRKSSNEWERDYPAFRSQYSRRNRRI